MVDFNKTKQNKQALNICMFARDNNNFAYVVGINAVGWLKHNGSTSRFVYVSRL